MPRRLLVFSLFIALGVLITLMGGFSFRMYRMEQTSQSLAQAEAYENELSLAVWQMESRALEVYNTSVAELASGLKDSYYVTSRYTIDNRISWGNIQSKDSYIDLSTNGLKLRASSNTDPEGSSIYQSMWCIANGVAIDSTEPPVFRYNKDETSNSLSWKQVEEIEKRNQDEVLNNNYIGHVDLEESYVTEYNTRIEKKKNEDYKNRAASLLKQKGATQKLLGNKESRRWEATKENGNIPNDSVLFKAASSVADIDLPELNNAVYQAGWVDEKLYLVRKSIQKDAFEVALLNHERVEKALIEGLGEVNLKGVEQPFLRVEKERMTFNPVTEMPYLANTLVTLPYHVSLQIPKALPLNSAWLRSLGVMWAALFLCVGIAAIFIRNILKLSQRRSQFVSSVTHELRTPLTSFQLYAEMLRDDLVPSVEKRHHYLDTLNKEAKRLAHLVENVLAYSQIEGGKVIKSTLTLQELTPAIWSRLQSRVQQTEASLRIEENVSSLQTISTDPTAVEQILFNLVDNACKYALDEKPNQEMVLTVEQRARTVCFTLKDQGPGISKKEQSKLFEPFHKSAEKAADTAKPGVGLGLSIAKRQAKVLGGKLSVSCPQSEGCEFSLSLPLE